MHCVWIPMAWMTRLQRDFQANHLLFQNKLPAVRPDHPIFEGEGTHFLIHFHIVGLRLRIYTFFLPRNSVSLPNQGMIQWEPQISRIRY